MIEKYVERWHKNREELKAMWSAHPPTVYLHIVKDLVRVVLNPQRESGEPDWLNVVEVDHGDYQGTLVYVIPEVAYQPSMYWAVKVSYGSCSGCDTLQACDTVDDYLTLALHVIQGLKEI
jgi:hypothetical protein